MKSKLYFLGIFLATLAVAASHQSEFPRFLLGFELLLCVFLFASVEVMRRNVTARLRIPEAFGKKKNDLRIAVELENAGRMPAPEVRVELTYTDLYDGTCKSMSGAAMLDGKGKAVLCFHMTSDYCGAVSFRISKVTVSDYLGVFQGKCKKTGSVLELSVLPLGDQKIDGIFGQTRLFSAEGDEYDAHRPGDDPSETYEIRQFRQGDTLHRVHWNMTAKTDDLLVRDFSQPAENTALVLCDLNRQNKKISRAQWDHFLETAASLSGRLLRAGNVHDAAWMDGETGRVVRCHVGNEDELQMMLSGLLRASAYDGGDIGMCYKESYADETCREIIRIDLEGKIISEKNEE